MWSSLRSDLTEFVSTVREDTSTALNQIDAGFDEVQASQQQSLEEKEARRRMRLPETFTAPLVPQQATTEGEGEAKGGDEEGDEKQGEGQEQEEEVPEDVKEFINAFSIDEKTDEIAALLEAHPDTLKEQFEELVPTVVTYEDFWQRYFYRCDVERIAREWDDEEGDEDGDGAGIKDALGSLLGGAVKAVSDKLKEDEHGQGSAPTSTAAALLQGTTRAPFAMNTVVDSEEEDDEELGWDDDDDDDEDDVEQEEEEASETMEFRDEATERLQEQLKQALEERDQLHATVEMQAKKIASLSSTKDGDEGGSLFKDEVEKLQTQLFEKESELAAFRAKSLDTSHGETSSTALEAKLASLAMEVQTKESMIAKLTKEAGEMASQVKESQEIIEQTKSENSALEAKLESLQNQDSKAAAGMANNVAADLEAMKTQLANTEKRASGAESELEATKGELAAAKQVASSVQTELKGVKQSLSTSEKRALNSGAQLAQSKEKLSVAETRILSLEKELEETRKRLAAAEDRALKAELHQPSSSPATTASTGVKVSAPASAEKLPVGDDDDWGDDWGDDDDLEGI